MLIPRATAISVANARIRHVRDSNRPVLPGSPSSLESSASAAVSELSTAGDSTGRGGPASALTAGVLWPQVGVGTIPSSDVEGLVFNALDEALERGVAGVPDPSPRG